MNLKVMYNFFHYSDIVNINIFNWLFYFVELVNNTSTFSNFIATKFKLDGKLHATAVYVIASIDDVVLGTNNYEIMTIISIALGIDLIDFVGF